MRLTLFPHDLKNLSFSTPDGKPPAFISLRELFQTPNEFDFEKEFNYGVPQEVMEKFNLNRETIRRLRADVGETLNVYGDKPKQESG